MEEENAIKGIPDDAVEEHLRTKCEFEWWMLDEEVGMFKCFIKHKFIAKFPMEQIKEEIMAFYKQAQEKGGIEQC